MTGNKEKRNLVEKHALNEIPKSERKNWMSIALIWTGSVISVSSLMIGGILVSGLPLIKAIIAGILGYSIVVFFMMFQGMQGADLGRPTVSSASSAFGESGAAFIISFVIGVAVMGWFGVQTSITGVAFSNIMNDWLNIQIPFQVSAGIWGIIMLATAIFGYKALTWLNYVAVPALVLLSVYGTYSVVTNFGFSGLLEYTPVSSFSFWHGVGLTVGGFAVGAVIAPDYSRYAKNRSGAVLSSLLGVLPVGVLLLGAGALMSIMAGTADMTAVVSSLGFPFVGLLILILATWTTNAVNAYSGGIAITSMFKLKDDKRALATGIAGLIGTTLAILGIMDYFVPFLVILTTGISPVAGVMVADYWILGRGKREKWLVTKGVRWTGVVAWIVGFAIGYFVKIGIAPINSIFASIVSFIILEKISKAQ